MTMIKVLIIEDEKAAVSRLKKELSKLEEFEFVVLDELSNVGDAVSYIESRSDIEIIFMDIHLTDGLSFEIFKQVDVQCPVIFTTAYDEYALQAFKVNSIDYLLKPINPDELRTSIEQYVAQTQKSPLNSNDYSSQLKQLTEAFKPKSYRSSFLVSFRQKMMMIDSDDVAYFYIKERGVFLKKKDGIEYVVDFFLDDLENQLDPSKFYRANRQFLVSRSSISEIEPYFNGRLVLLVKPEAHTSVVISKEKATHFKRWADY